MTSIDILFYILKFKTINKDSIKKIEEDLNFHIISSNSDLPLKINKLNLSYKQVLELLYFLRNELTNQRINELIEKQEEYKKTLQNKQSREKEIKDTVFKLRSICDELKYAFENNTVPYIPAY